MVRTLSIHSINGSRPVHTLATRQGIRIRGKPDALANSFKMYAVLNPIDLRIMANDTQAHQI